MWGHEAQEAEAHAQKDAQYQHAMHVFDALRDFAYEISDPLPTQLKANDAVYYMRYGAGRRLLMIWRSYRTITLTTPPERQEPLSDDEETTLSRDINVIYMHLRGVLDNFSWCFLFEKEPEIANNINPLSVSLFSKEIRKRTKYNTFWDELDKHSDWSNDAKSRRDPVAHRIPLYVPPSLLIGDEQTEYQDLTRRWYEAANRRDFDTCDLLNEQRQQIGTFLPCFVHHPDQGTIPIYPTLPTDMTHLIRIGQILKDHIK